MRCFLKAWITLGVWVFTFNVNAQTFELPITKKLQIGLNTSQYSFFDGSQFIQNGYGNWFYTLMQTRGYEISYFFYKNGFRFSYNKLVIYYPLNITHPKVIGSIKERDYKLFHLEYLRKIYTLKKTELYLSAGGTYRTGTDDIIIGYDLYGPHLSGYFANAFGLSVGTYFLAPIYKGINVNLGFKYTGFVYRKYTGGQFAFEDDGSTKHMFGVTLGLGYTFNFKSK